MRLKTLKIKNFRCYQEETNIEFDNLTALIGKNDAGKSALMETLDIFFNDKKPDKDDLCRSAGDQGEICITCVFDNLPERLVIDASNETTLDNEYLLNEQGKLEIKKVVKIQKTVGTPKIYAVANHPSDKKFNDLLSLKQRELKKRAVELQIDVAAINQNKNAEYRKAIWNSAENLQLQVQDISILDLEGGKNIWAKLQENMPVYSLFKSDRPSTDQDAEAQDPIQAAVKESLKVKQAELQAIQSHVEQEVAEILQTTLEKLREMDASLADALRPEFKPPGWDKIFKINVIDNNDIPINKRGSGVRRLLLLNFFRAKVEQLAQAAGKSQVIYAVEEPETSQHPNNQKLLIDAFTELADNGDCQVILSTHTPAMVRYLSVERLRFITRNSNDKPEIQAGSDDVYEHIAQTLGVLPDHSVKLFIGVEGPNDVNFLKNISAILSASDEDMPNLEQLEDEGKIIFLEAGGSNLASFVNKKFSEFNRPEYHIFDREQEPPTPSQNQTYVDAINNDGNSQRSARLTQKREMENYLHPDAIKCVRPEVDIQFEDFDDVPEMISQVTGQNHRTIKRWLNAEAVCKMTPERLVERDSSNEIRGWLSDIKQLFVE